jgi:hypothetical protein
MASITPKIDLTTALADDYIEYPGATVTLEARTGE